MNKKYIFTIIITALVAATLVESRHFGEMASHSEESAPTESAIASPYKGQESRTIKALSESDIEGLLSGAGTPFGGMAKPAELNGYPGPRHVLDAVEAGEFEVSSEQKMEIENMYEKMKAHAIVLGTDIVAIERDIDKHFAEGTMTEEFLVANVNRSADLYKALRILHLRYHLMMVDVLTSEQVTTYNELRGYTAGGDPCASVPEGHDPELWKQHNNCE